MQRKEFERVTPEEVGISSSSILQLLDHLESGFTEPHGLMIMRHGKICAEGWWKPFAPGIPHGQQSHSKTYAATAIGIAYTEGIVDLEERLIDIFPEEAPENPSENLKKLTIHHVLCMSCGMEQMPAPSQNWIRDFLSTEVSHEPGTTYMYNSTGSTILGAIIRKKTGLGLCDYLKPRLFDKIGIDTQHLHWICMPDGMEIGGGGLYSTTEDNLRLMKLYADGGVWENERILATDYVKKATSFQIATESESIGNPEATDNFLGYGYQIWMCKPTGVYRADGAMGQFTIVDPQRDLILSITENASGAHWAQKSLDVIWEFLEQVPIAPFNFHVHSVNSTRLKDRLSRLSLAAPIFSPYSPLSSIINGHTYHLQDSNLYFSYFGMIHIMAGLPKPAPVSAIHFSFHNDSCILTCINNEQQQQIIKADMQGGEQENILNANIPNRALASAYWEKEDTLSFSLRWIETCDVITYHFHFYSNCVKTTFASCENFISQEIVSYGKR